MIDKIDKHNKKQKQKKKRNTHTKKNTKKYTKKKSLSERDNYTKIIKPTLNPNKLPKNKLSMKNGNLFKVSTYKGKKTWRKASKKDIKCNNYLQDKINYNISKYKNGKYKTSKQAIAISYSQTKKKFPDCNL